jgi:hypothetical protein
MTCLAEVICSLLGGQQALPAEHPRLERATMVEGKNVERIMISANVHVYSLSFLQRPAVSFLLRQRPYPFGNFWLVDALRVSVIEIFNDLRLKPLL